MLDWRNNIKEIAVLRFQELLLQLLLLGLLLLIVRDVMSYWLPQADSLRLISRATDKTPA